MQHACQMHENIKTGNLELGPNFVDFRRCNDNIKMDLRDVKFVVMDCVKRPVVGTFNITVNPRFT